MSVGEHCAGYDSLIGRKLALIVEYDGTRYSGFQLQTAQPTIQGAIEEALVRFTGQPTRIRGASRTDSGAHALGQVVDFETRAGYPVEIFSQALNYYLPPDVKIQAGYEMLPEFHCRRDASSRTYRYLIVNRLVPSPVRRYTHHWVRESLDVDRMSAGASALVGQHDFRSLAAGYPADLSAVRMVRRWEVWRDGDTVIIECEANGFLRHQIRRANGLLVGIGLSRWTKEIITDVLEGRLSQRFGWPSLPARGLCLMRVTYPNFWSRVRTENEAY